MDDTTNLLIIAAVAAGGYYWYSKKKKKDSSASQVITNKKTKTIKNSTKVSDTKPAKSMENDIDLGDYKSFLASIGNGRDSFSDLDCPAPCFCYVKSAKPWYADGLQCFECCFGKQLDSLTTTEKGNFIKFVNYICVDQVDSSKTIEAQFEEAKTIAQAVMDVESNWFVVNYTVEIFVIWQVLARENAKYVLTSSQFQDMLDRRWSLFWNCTLAGVQFKEFVANQISTFKANPEASFDSNGKYIKPESSATNQNANDDDDISDGDSSDDENGDSDSDDNE